MGYITEFNWILKLKEEQGLNETNIEVDKIYDFNKKDNRVYPLGIPMLLVNNNWEAVGTVEVLESTINKNSTIGKYKVIKIHQDVDKEVLTKFLQDNIKYYKKEKNIEDFSELKAT